MWRVLTRSLGLLSTIWRDYVGPLQSVPLRTAKLAALAQWAFVSTLHTSECYDYGSGRHQGRWVTDVQPDGTVTVHTHNRDFYDSNKKHDELIQLARIEELKRAVAQPSPGLKARMKTAWLKGKQIPASELAVLEALAQKLRCTPKLVAKVKDSNSEYIAVEVKGGHVTGLALPWFDKRAAIPDSIDALTRLKVFRAVGNKLKSVPDSLWNISCLVHLDLGYNRLASLPTGLGNLTKLRMLDLTSNELKSLPSSIGELTSLRCLMIGKNQLTELPDSITVLRSLRKLQLSGNYLETGEKREAVKLLINSSRDVAARCGCKLIPLAARRRKS